MSFIFGAVIGVVVGWVVPQPQWFKDFMDKVRKENP